MAQHIVPQISRQTRRHGAVQPGGDGYGRVPVLPEVELRRYRRETQLQGCTYQMVECLESKALVIETGQAIAVNRSIGGMLLMMSHAPGSGKYLEVHTKPVMGRRTAYLMEVRWTKPIRSGSEGDLFLVGCRCAFGPCQYFQF